MSQRSRTRLAAFADAFRGLSATIRSEPNAKIHLAASVLVVSLAGYFGVSRWEWVALVVAICSVIGAECLNTAVEHLADRVTKENDPLIGLAKDAAAAGVLVVSIGAAVVGLLVFGPPLWERVNALL